MSTPDRTIDPRIIESAKREFLAYGFEKASLKAVCEKAGVTTGALYRRYKGKEALFSAVVADTIADLNEYVTEKKKLLPQMLSDHDLVNLWGMDEEGMMWWFRFLYERHDGFVLLLKCSEGTRYSNFQHELVEMVTDYTYLFFEEAYRRKLAKAVVSKEELHILQAAYWETIFEPFIHGFTWEQIETHCKRVCRFLNWKDALGLVEPEVI